MKILNILIVLALVVTIGNIVVTYKGNTYWIGHATIGASGFILAISVLIMGAALRRRIKRIRSPNLLKIHRRIAISFGLFIVGTFLYGLWITSWRHGVRILLPASFHGRLGLGIVVTAMLQVIPSVVVKKRKKIRKAHMILGYALPPLVLLQVVWGTYTAVGYIKPWLGK